MNEIPIVQSKLFSNYKHLKFGISTRVGGVSPEPFGLNLSFNVGDDRVRVNENRRRFFSALAIPLEQLAIPDQVHSANVCLVSKPGAYESCDSLITITSEIFLVVTVADCLPIFLFDPTTKSIGVVHVGWRGSKLRILENTIKAMETEFGTKRKNIMATIGPSARTCCYEVGKDVANEFNEKFLSRSENKKYYLDLILFNRDILIDSGIYENHIEILQDCTICNRSLFHSYRRDGKASGRMMGVIGISI
jgi:hypothetical protein